MKYRGVLIDSISVFTAPSLYLELTIYLIVDAFRWLKNFILKRGILLFIITLTWLLISNVDALQVLPNPYRLLRTSSTSSRTGSFWELPPPSALALVCIRLYCTWGHILRR